MKENNSYIEFLIRYCSEYPELYNKVARILYNSFDSKVEAGANVILLCTYVAAEVMKGSDKE